MKQVRKILFLIMMLLCLCSPKQTVEAYAARLDGFYLTWYGRESDNITAMGTTPRSYYTIAVDPNIIPLGSYCTVVFPTGEAYECRAEDTGGLIHGYRIDMYVYEAEWYWDNVDDVTVYIH